MWVWAMTESGFRAVCVTLFACLEIGLMAGACSCSRCEDLVERKVSPSGEVLATITSAGCGTLATDGSIYWLTLQSRGRGERPRRVVTIRGTRQPSVVWRSNQALDVSFDDGADLTIQHTRVVLSSAGPRIVRIRLRPIVSSRTE